LLLPLAAIFHATPLMPLRRHFRSAAMMMPRRHYCLFHAMPLLSLFFADADIISLFRHAAAIDAIDFQPLRCFSFFHFFDYYFHLR
jgi:hypothetical protein